MAVSQEPGPPRPDWLPLWSDAKVFFMVRVLHVEWVTASALWRGRQRVTVVDNCKGRVSCKGSVFKQLASRWANDGPAGQLSRSQWVWLWDIPKVLVWTAWNPQGKHRPPTHCVSPAVPQTRLPHQTHVQICLSLLVVWRIYLTIYIDEFKKVWSVLFCDSLSGLKDNQIVSRQKMNVIKIFWKPIRVRVI